MKEVPLISPADRPVIRVFISSTFRDMHAERDAINRLVFPELRRRCLLRGAEFIGVDMRWGITEDEIQREGTLAICLHEIERSRPFFVCLLAERFGSVYPPEEVTTALVEAARAVPALHPIVDQWYRLDDTVISPVYRLHRTLGPMMANEEAAALVRFWEAQGLTGAGDSLTAREILRGVFEDGYPPTRALFYLRRAGLTHQAGFPAALVPVFVEQDTDRRQKLATMKHRIRRQRPRHVVRPYAATYAGLRLDPTLMPPDLPANDQAALSQIVTPGQWSSLSEQARDALTRQGTVALSGMDTLAEQMIDDLWQAIEPELVRPAQPLDSHERERAYHERFVTRHTAFFRSRDAEIEHVLKYVGDTRDREVFVVTGDPGAGKSAFMAECVRVCREQHPEALIIPHFIGAAPESASLPATLRSLCETLRRKMGLEEDVAEDPEKLRFQLRAFLEQAGANRPIVLFLDALNQLDPAGRSHELDWLPMMAPHATRVIVSALKGDCHEQLARHVPPDHIVTIPALSAPERRTLITDFLARRRKTLTLNQLDALLDVSERRDAELPLYTLVSLEELCLFGDHEALIQRIRLLPPTLPELFDQVLARLEQDHTRATVEAVCSWLAVTRSGLLESEVLGLLGTEGGFPRMRWTRLYRAIEPYLKPIEEETADSAKGRLDFYHDQFRFAVFHRYLHMAAPDAAQTDAFRSTHRQLAGYFRGVVYDATLPTKWRPDQVRGLSELPFHQTRSEEWKELDETLCDLSFIAAKCATGMTYDLVADFAFALRAMPGCDEEQAKRRAIEDRVKHYLEAVIVYCKRVFDSRRGVPCGIPGEAFPALPPARRLARPNQEPGRINYASTSTERVRAFSYFVNAQTHVLEKQANDDLCLQQAHNYTCDGPVHDAAVLRLGTTSERIVLLDVRGTAQRADIHPVMIKTIRGYSKGDPVLHRLTSGASNGLNSVRVSGSGHTFVAFNKKTGFTVFDTETGARLKTFAGPESDLQASWISADGTDLVVCHGFNSLQRWNLSNEPRVDNIRLDRKFLSAYIAPDGDHAYLGDSFGRLSLLEISTRKTVETWWPLKSVFHGVREISVTANQRFVISGGMGIGGNPGLRSKSLRIWDLEKDRYILCKADTNRSTRLAVSALTRAASTVDGTIRIWDLQEGTCERTLHTGGHITALAFTADGAFLISGSYDGELQVWDLSSGECVWEDRVSPVGVLDIAVTPDGHRAVCACGDGDYHVLDIEGTSKTAGRGLDVNFSNVSLAAGGRHAILGTGHSLKSSGKFCADIWDSRQGHLRTLQGHLGPVCAVAVLPDTRNVAARWNCLMRIWNCETGVCLWEFKSSWLARMWAHFGPGDEFTSLVPTGDGSRMILARLGGTIEVFDLPKQLTVGRLISEAGPVLTRPGQRVCVSADGRLVLAPVGEGVVGVWVLDELGNVQGVERVLRGRAHVGIGMKPRRDDFVGERSKLWINALAITNDGRTVATGNGDGSICVWDLGSGALRHTLLGHENSVLALATTADCRHILSGSVDHTVRVWDIFTGECVGLVARESGVRSMSSKGNMIVISDDTGDVSFLECRGLNLGRMVVTIVRPYRIESATWEDSLVVVCESCGRQFTAPDLAVSTIKSLGQPRRASRGFAQPPPCLTVEDTAWDEPSLIISCPHCMSKLKCNPFILDTSFPRL